MWISSKKHPHGIRNGQGDYLFGICEELTNEDCIEWDFGLVQRSKCTSLFCCIADYPQESLYKRSISAFLLIWNLKELTYISPDVKNSQYEQNKAEQFCLCHHLLIFAWYLQLRLSDVLCRSPCNWVPAVLYCLYLSFEIFVKMTNTHISWSCAEKTNFTFTPNRVESKKL